MNRKKTNLLYVALGFVMVAFALTFFPNTSITGHVSVEAGYQSLDMLIEESQSYVISSDYEDSLIITFMRLSGEVIGDGRAEVIIDNGLGQRLIVYSNLEEEQEPNLITGMKSNKITGMVVGEEEMDKLSLLNLIERGKLSDLSLELPKGRILTKGKFANVCKHTCLMEMELSRDSNYILEFKVSEGTKLRLDNMIYGILLQ